MSDQRIGMTVHLSPADYEKLTLCAQRSNRSRKAEAELRLRDHLLRFKASNKNIITRRGVEFVAIDNDD
jgi:hypothetical protein